MKRSRVWKRKQNAQNETARGTHFQYHNLGSLNMVWVSYIDIQISSSMAHSAIFRGANRDWFCSSECFVRLGAALSCRRWLSFGPDLHATSNVRNGVGWVDDRLRQSRSRLLRILGWRWRLLGRSDDDDTCMLSTRSLEWCAWVSYVCRSVVVMFFARFSRINRASGFRSVFLN